MCIRGKMEAIGRKNSCLKERCEKKANEVNHSFLYLAGHKYDDERVLTQSVSHTQRLQKEL